MSATGKDPEMNNATPFSGFKITHHGCKSDMMEDLDKGGVLTLLYRYVLARHFSSAEQTVMSVTYIWLALHLAGAIYSRHFNLSDLPGPIFAAYTRLWLSKAYASGCLYEVYHTITTKYGPIIRIGPNHVLLSDPDASIRILGPRSRYERGPWYDAFRIEPNRANIVSERHRPSHLHMRHQMASGYNGKDIAGFEKIVNDRIIDLLDHISRQWVSRTGTTVVLDIGRWIRHMTMDTITHISFGRPAGYLEQDKDVLGFTTVMEKLLPVVLHFSVFTELNSILRILGRIPWCRRNLFPHHTHSKGIGRVKAIAKEVIASRLLPRPNQSTDMLDSFLRHGLSPAEAESEIAISLVAGSDTTSTGLRATLLAIISNSTVYHKLQTEIDTAVFSGLVSNPIKDSEARRLPYLQACIYEGLRCHPPLVMPRERIVPREGDVICGFKLEGGTSVGINVWSSQRSKVFGSDPEVFRPERWLDMDKEQLKAMVKVWELIFGHGTTKCLGQNLAMMTMNKFFPELLRRFDVSILDPSRPWHSECYGIFFQREFNVRITERASI